jgi:hypothetical protein
MPSRKLGQPDPEVAASAPFIFRGTVTGAGRSNLDGVAAEAGLAMVRVDEVVLAPPQVALAPGQEVTVALAQGQPVANGEHYVWYASSWHYGSTLGVAELARQKVDISSLAATASAVDTVRSDAVDRRLRRLDEALASRLRAVPLVVSGRVLSVAEVPTVELYLEGTHWREAEVWVAQTLKGVPPADLRVVFPVADKEHASAPQFFEGMDGIWLLRRRESEPPGYVALDPLDFHAPSALERILTLLTAVS